MTEYLAMGGYAAFIWPTYAVAAVLLTGLLVLSLRTMRQRESLVDSLRRDRGQRRAASTQILEAET